MSSRIVLVTGGSRSGKSAHAQKRAEAIVGKRVYVATCPVIDGEMEERVRRHREARNTRDWQTVEEPVDLAGAIARAKGSSVVLVDCLTLWVNNLMYEAEIRGERLSESAIASRCEPVVEAARHLDSTVLFVTNETGMGIVPENPVSRHFRDLAGRVNQVIAAAADEVVLVVCGQPLCIKFPPPHSPETNPIP